MLLLLLLLCCCWGWFSPGGCCYYCCCAAAEVGWVAGHFFANKTTKNKKLWKFMKNIKFWKTIWGVPSDLLVSGRRTAIPCQIEPVKRRLMRRAPPQSSAEIQTCFIMYPWQANNSLPRGRKCEKKHSVAGEQRAKERAKKKRRSYFTYTYAVVQEWQQYVMTANNTWWPPDQGTTRRTIRF